MTGSKFECKLFILEFGRETECKLFMLDFGSELECKLFILDFGNEMECKFFILDLCKATFLSNCKEDLSLRELRIVRDKVFDVRAVFGTAVRAGTRILDRAGLNLKFSTEQFVLSETNKVGRICT